MICFTPDDFTSQRDYFTQRSLAALNRAFASSELVFFRFVAVTMCHNKVT
jgi:hypothetical protein